MVITTDVKSGVAALEKWLRTQYHLPQCIEEQVLSRFFHTCQGDLEYAKKLLDNNYTMRNHYSHIFLKRDPITEAAQNILKTTDMLILPGLTKDGNKVFLYRLADTDPEKHDFTEAIKVFFMFADIRFITPDPAGTTAGEIPIFDMTGYSLRHLTKVVLSSLRIYMKFIQEAHPIRLREIHVINCPIYLNKVLAVMRPFIKSEVFQLIRFHLPGSDTLYSSIPKDMLPFEYGGKAGKIEDIKRKWVDILIQKRDYLTNEKYWKVNEQKRCNSKKNSLEGNFKTLTID